MIQKAEDSYRMSSAIKKAVYSSEKFLEAVENTIAHAVNAGSDTAFLSKGMFMHFSTDTLEKAEQVLQDLGYTTTKWTILLDETQTWVQADSFSVFWGKK